MLEIFQPAINEVLTGLLSLLTLIILAAFAELRRRVLRYIDNRNDLKHQEIIKNLAVDAFSYVEANFKNEASKKKLGEAVFFVSKRLEKRGIDISTDEIVGAIEAAVIQFNKDKK